MVSYNSDAAITTDDFIQGEQHRFSNRHRNTLQLLRNQILHFSILLAQVASFHIFYNIANILCQKGLSTHFWYVEFLPRRFRFTAIPYTLMNVMDNLLCSLFGFNSKPLAFVHKISAEDSNFFGALLKFFFFLSP